MNKWLRILRVTGRLAGIALGAVISAVSIQAFVVHAGLGSGGLGGIALLLFYKFQLPIGLVTLLLNIPLFILGWREVNKRFVFKTLFGLILFSLFLDLFKGIQILPFDDIFLGALYGGVIGGIGGALVFRLGGSLGGIDILAKVIERKFGWGLGTTSLTFNIFIILASWAVLGPKVALYTLVSMFAYSRTLDAVLTGIPAKAVTVISEQPQELVQHILTDLGRGATFLAGRGAYSDGAKDIIICVVSMPEVGRLKEIVREIDPKAFMIVQNASEVIGKGFAKKE